MMKEAIEKILGLADVEKSTLRIGDRMYCRERLDGIKDPSCEPLVLHTLTGLVDWVKNKDEPNASIIHVQNETNVYAISDIHTIWRDREIFAHCQRFSVHRFDSEKFMKIEDMIVELQTKFLDSDDLQRLYMNLSSISGELVITAEDDGAAQTVTIKDAIGRLKDEKLDPIFTLIPMRTFAEISQPLSSYLLRFMKVKGCLPMVALYRIANDAWRNEAIASIKKYLEDADLGVPIIA